MLKSLKEVIQYRGLVRHMVASDLKARYRGSVLGFLWTLLNPLMLTLVLWAVFSRLARMDERSYALFLLSGLMVWLFFQQSIQQSLKSITSNRALLQKIYVPKLIFPLVVVTSNAVNLGFFVLAYLIIALCVEQSVPSTAIALVPIVALGFLTVTGLSLCAATVNVFFRDAEHLFAVILRALFYFTPVIYGPALVGDMAPLLAYNPAYFLVVASRDVLYDGVLPPTDIWLQGAGFAASSMLLGVLVLTRYQDKFVYYA